MKKTVVCMGFFFMFAGLSLAQEAKLLTENGLANSQYSYYKDKPYYVTGGSYLARPGMSETDYAEKALPFSEGCLTNGDFSYAYKRKPMPYAYWRDRKQGEIVFDFKKTYTVVKVALNVNVDGAHGTGSLEFSKSTDGEKFQQFSSSEKIDGGWYEITGIKEDLRYLKIRFGAAEGKRFTTCSEVEVWGFPADGQAVKTPKTAEGDIVIIIAKDAPKVVRFAAGELQAYFKKISGEEIPVAGDDAEVKTREYILVGDSKYLRGLNIRKDFPPDAFLIKRAGDKLILAGDDADSGTGRDGIPFDYRTSRKGSLYAVYTLLEKCYGVRWFWPGQSGEIVPQAKKIILPGKIDIYEKPVFLWRHFWHVSNPSVEADPSEIPLWYMRNKFGVSIGSPYGFSHSWASYLTNDYFKDHPEYFPLVDGKRQPHIEIARHGKQVCTSNPEVVNLFVEKIRKRYKPDDDTIVSISPDDGGEFCECENCRKLDHPELYGPDEGYDGKVLSDRIFTFANQVAREVKKTHPKLKVGIFSYTYLRPAPKTIKKMEDNIIISITQLNAQYNDEKAKKDTRKRIDEWSGKCSALIGRDYFGSLMFGVIHPQIKILTDDISYLNKHNFIGFYWEGANYFAANHLNYYLMSKLLWNPDINTQEVLQDYYDRAYGSASGIIKEYFTMMEDSFNSRVPAGTLYSGNIPQWYSRETIEKGYALLNAAKKAAGKDEKIKERIDYLLLAHTYTDKAVAFIRCAQVLVDNGFPLRLRGYTKHTAPEKPSMDIMRGYIKEAREKGRDFYAFVEKYKENSAVDYYEPVLDERVYRTLASVEDLYSLYVEGNRDVVELPLAWKFMTDPENSGEKQGWYKMDYKDDTWGTINTDTWWTGQNYPDYTGSAWYRLDRFTVPAEYKSRRTVLRFGAVDESCWVYVNGEPVGSLVYDAGKDPDSWKKPLEFDITGYVKYGTENTFAVKVRSEAGAGGIWQKVFLLFEEKESAGKIVFHEGFEGEFKASRRGEDCESEITDGAAYSGRKSFFIKVKSPYPNMFSMSLGKIPVEGGKDYLASLVYKADNVRENGEQSSKWLKQPLFPSVRIYFLDAEGKNITPTKEYVWFGGAFKDKVPEWTPLRRIMKTPPGAAALSLTVFFNCQGDYWIDDIKIEQM